MSITVPASVAAIAVAGVVIASAGITYVIVKSSVTADVSCPAMATTAKPILPTGPRLPIQGKTY
jgi:hypothetical protein